MGDRSPIRGTKKALRPTVKAMGAIKSLALTEQGYNWGNGHRKMLFWLCGILLLASNVKGQNASATPTPVGQTAQQLIQVIVTAGIPIEESVLPKMTPTDTLLSTDITVIT